MKKTLTASLLAMMMTASLCACGTDDIPAKSQTADIAAAAETTTTEQTETEQTTAAETTTEESTAEETTKEKAGTEKPEESGETTVSTKKGGKADYGQKPSADDELATVQYLADTYFKAVENCDYEKLTEIVDVELMYYLENGETGTHKDHLNAVRTISASSGAQTDMTVGKPEKESGTAAQYNAFFKKMDEMNGGGSDIAKKFKVEDVYSVRVRTNTKSDLGSGIGSFFGSENSGIDINISGSFDINLDVDLPIIKVNGEWKCDPAIGMMMSVMDIFM